jgi:transcription elongation factor GreA
MYDELTQVDIKKMQEEIDYRVNVLRPKLIEEVQTTRAFGDLSENFEYKTAKQLKNKNESRIRYLERMIKTAKVITDKSSPDTAGLFDWGELYFEEDDETQKIRLVTTLRQNSLKWLISKESPLGKAVMGRKVGDRVLVKVNEDYSYHVIIRSIEKGEDDESIEIGSY